MTTTERNTVMQRHQLLARWTAEPRLGEQPLIDLAKVIDPEAWKVRDFFNRRFLSLEAAYRVSIHNAAHQAVHQMAVWQPAPAPVRKSFFSRFRRAA